MSTNKKRRVSSSAEEQPTMADLLQQISKLELQVANLTGSLTAPMNTTQTKTRKPHKNINYTVKAKLLYYHEHKNDIDIIDSVRSKLIAESRPYTRMEPRSTGSVLVEVIPWRAIKAACDTRFDTLTDVKKSMYIEFAKSKYPKPQQ